MPRLRSAHPTVLLAILCAAAFMGSLDLFIVNVGLRDIGRDVGAGSLANLSWVLNAYAIVLAALLVPAGRLADRYGNKATFLIGLALFTVASLGCAVSGALWPIVALRGLQAAGAAALTPASLGLILTVLPPARRRAGMQVWAVTGSLGAAAGPALGGLLVELSWRWIFVVNLPIGLAAIAGTAVFMPNVKHQVESRVPDLLGGGLLIVAIGALALALVQGPSWGWGSASTLGGFAASAAALALFVVRSSRHHTPVVDLELWRSPAFAWGNITMFLVSISFGAQLLGLVLWLQEGWGWSALTTGLAIAPGPIMVSVTAIGLRRFTAALPAGATIAFGTLLMGAGGVLIGVSIGADPHYLAILPGWLIVGAGVGFAMPTILGAATAGLAPHQASTGSAVVQMDRQIGSVLGVALLVIVLGSSTASADLLDRFPEVWWWAGGFALASAVAALGISPLRRASRARAAEVAATAAG
jgi:EmrB/QacA subfamily drug resistance transporter